MHIEFAEIIRKAALEAIAAGELPGDSESTFPQVHAEIAEFTERGDVSSSWSFRFTNWSKNRGHIIEPLRVSEIIRARIMSGEHRFVEVVLSPNGYLNARLTGEGRDTFLKTIMTEQWRGLFTSAPLLNEASLAGDRAGLSVEDSDISSAAPAQMILQQCDLIDRLFDRPAMEELKSSEVSSTPGRSEVMLMACSSLARKEYRLEPFVERLKCKENVPWYCARGLGDMKSFEKCLSRQIGLATGRDREEKLFASFADEFEDHLLRFRSFSIPALRGGRYDKLAEYFLSVFDCFYRYYNHPHVRHAESAASRDRLSGILSCQRSVIEAALRILA